MAVRRAFFVVLMVLLSVAFELRSVPAQEPLTQDCSLPVGCTYLGTGTAVWDTGEIGNPFRATTFIIDMVIVVSTPAGSSATVLVIGAYTETFPQSSCSIGAGVGTLKVLSQVSADGTLLLLIGKGSDLLPIFAMCTGTGGNVIPFNFPPYLPDYIMAGLALADGATAKGFISPAAQAAGQSGTITLTLHDPRTGPGDVSVQSSQTPSVIGGDITFTAALTAGGGSGGSGGCVTPTGDVTFLDGTTILGTGTHTITAIYGGDSKCPVRLLAPLTQEVQGP